MPLGYWGRILRVDLSSGALSLDERNSDFYRTYLGGRGIIAHYLLHEQKPDTDPLGPDNLLIFAPSVLTGAGIPGSARNSIGARSPLTGAYGEAEGGGVWGVRLRWAGYDGLVVKGRAKQPVYLWINNDTAELRSASHLWGLTVADTQAAIRAEVGDERASVAVIGPAGERLSVLSCIALDTHNFAGRCGLGAVMGSKNLKAVAVNGKTRPQVADAKAIQAMARWLSETAAATLGTMKEMGTARGVPGLNEAGGLPTRNFRQGSFEGYQSIAGRYMTDTILVDRESCYACPVHCKRVVEVNDAGLEVTREYGGPEYETIGAFGSLLAIADIKVIARANALCNANGLDTISTGAMIGGALEAAEKGLLPPELAAGLDLRFGSAPGVLALLEQIIARRGLGDILAQGPRYARQRLGEAAGHYFWHIKNQPIPMHEPRWKRGMGLGYAISPTGADHIHNIHDPGYSNADAPGFAMPREMGILEAVDSLDLGPAKVRLFVYLMLFKSLLNSIDVCTFMPYGLQQATDLVKSVTGWNTTTWEMIKAAERALAMTVVFNTRHGLTPADDVLPDRFFEPLENGLLQGAALDRRQFYAARNLTYQMLGRDVETGAMLPWKLHELGLSDLLSAA